MELSVTNFFTHYVIHPQADELEGWEKNIALISSVVLGILTLGLLHFAVYICSEAESPLNARDITVLTPRAPRGDAEVGEADDAASRASYAPPARLLLLEGDYGTVACRIYGLLSKTIPRFSDNWTLESATRSLLRMNNLIAVRGVPGASMVGPADYLGNLEDPDQYLYTIQAGTPPVFYRIPLTDENFRQDPVLTPFDNSVPTIVRVNWVSGKQTDLVRAKRAEYHVPESQNQHSIFPDPGLLEVDRKRIELRLFDPRGVDLSSFKARLVDNSAPFQITKEKLPSKEEYRLITYFYEGGYAQWQVESGSGLFLETHTFAQTITPVRPDSGGFVTLARRNETPGELEIIGVRVPYGHTLIIENGSIHGDSTLNGFFLMGMTSDHTIMSTADTVFLKHSQTKENVEMVIRDLEENPNTIPLDNPAGVEMTPHVIYKGASEEDRRTFKQSIQGKSLIFNPSSTEYWK